MPRLAPTRRRRAIAPIEEISALPPEERKALLINEYAAKRHEHPAGSKAAVYIGIVICAVVVVAGWAMTTGRTLFAPSHPDATINAVANSASIFLK